MSPKVKDKPKVKPEVELSSLDGNAFMIIGRCRKAAFKAGWTDERWEKVMAEMKAGDFDHLLTTVQNYFEVS